MKTIKIIDLLNKIANGEEVPKKIKLDGDIFEYNSFYKSFIDDNRNEDLLCCVIGDELNNEVEILDEEDEFEDIEELSFKDLAISINETYNDNVDVLMNKINELIKNQKKIIERLKNESKD